MKRESGTGTVTDFLILIVCHANFILIQDTPEYPDIDNLVKCNYIFFF